MRMSLTAAALVAGCTFFAVNAPAEAPEHYFNAPENLNPDPNYVPGEWPFPDPFQARTIYQARKTELAQTYAAAEPGNLFTLGMGEITFTAMKNETAPVTGYFRDYAGAVRFNAAGAERAEFLIDVNSLDTGVPGRNNRILDIFFQSMKPDFGTIALVFDQFQPEEAGRVIRRDGAFGQLTAKASGTVTLNGVSKPVTARLSIAYSGGTWTVKTLEPVEIRISDFGFGERVQALIRECNHKALGDRVQVKAELYLR